MLVGNGLLDCQLVLLVECEEHPCLNVSAFKISNIGQKFKTPALGSVGV
jgi:hypothetical protein